MKKEYLNILLIAASLAIVLAISLGGNNPSEARAGFSSTEEYRRLNTVSCGMGGYVPGDFLRLPIGQVEGVGKIDFPISTRSKEAQLYFNQGMVFYYNFDWVRAAQSFYQAEKYDPASAMVSYGISISRLEMLDRSKDTNDVRALLAQAAGKAAMQTDITAFEQQLIALHVTHAEPVSNDSAINNKQKQDALAKAGTLIKQFPDNPESWIAASGIRRAYLMPEEKKRFADSIAVQYLHSALEQKPGHFGAIHLLIHGYEALAEFENSLKYGQLYTEAAPEIPHAWHMYAHDLMKTGRVDAAIDNFNKAYALEKKIYNDFDMPSTYDWHHSHNLELMAYSYQHEGKMKQAEKIFQMLDSFPGIDDENGIYFKKAHPYFLLQTGRYDEAIALGNKMASGTGIINVYFGNLSAGLGYMLKKDEPNALAASAKITHILDSLRADAIAKGATEEEMAEGEMFLKGMQSLIHAGLGLQKSPNDLTLQMPIKGIQEAMLQQTGPDPWIDALYFLQLLTNITFSSGNMALAEGSARAMIQHDAYYGGGYFWLAKILVKQGKPEEARQTLEKAKGRYTQADPAVLESLSKVLP